MNRSHQLHGRKRQTIVDRKRSGYKCWSIAKEFKMSIEMVVAVLVDGGLVRKNHLGMRIENAHRRVY